VNAPRENRKLTPIRPLRRAGMPYPNPGARAGDLDTSPVVGFTVTGRGPPPPNHVPTPPPVGDPHRSLDVQMAAMQTEDDVLAFVAFPLFACAGLLFASGKYVAAGLFVALIALLFVASYFARRPRIQHRVARLLRGALYKSFTYPGDRRRPRLSLRLSVIVVVSILLGLFARGR